MTQRNAALVERSAVAAEALKREAARLSGLVAVFSFDAGEVQPPLEHEIDGLRLAA